MHLVYLLKLNINNGDYKEFKFHSNAKITYKSNTNEINISGLSKNVPLIDSFLLDKYKNISNLNVIIGNNGAGKTTLLKTISNFFNFEEHENYKKEKYDQLLLGIFFDNSNSEFHFYSVGNDYNIRVKYSSNNDYKILKKLSYINFKKIVPRKSIVYLTENLSSGDFFSGNRNLILDISVGNILYNISRSITAGDASGITNPVTRYFYQETLKQLQFIQDYKEKAALLPFKLPEFLKVEIDNSNVNSGFINTIVSSMGKTNEFKKTEGIINKIINKLRSNNEIFSNNLFTIIFQNAIINFLNQSFELLFFNTKVNPDFKNNFSKFGIDVESMSINRESLEEITKILINNFETKNFPTESLINLKNRYKHSLNIIEDNIDLNLDNDFFEINDYSLRLNTNTIDLFIKECIEISPEIFLNFSWYLSTGENHFLNLYSKILQVKKENRNINDSTYSSHLWLLIDEGNASFHPEWQAKYTELILSIVTELLEDYSVQIFMTTHSPIVLSDIPNHNVTYIHSKSDNNRTTDESNQLNQYNTFGQNIYNLFSESFFLNQVNGSLAEDTFKKIDEKLKQLEVKSASDLKAIQDKLPEKSLLSSLEAVVDIIGEKIIRETFQDRIARLYNNNRTGKVINSIQLYNSMDGKEREEFIKEIINIQKKDD